MEILKNASKRWVIVHAGREIAQEFETESEANAWADKWIDDQVFDGPNSFSPPLTYRTQRN